MMQKTKNGINELRISKRQLFSLAVVLLLFYALLPQIGEFRLSFDAVKQAQPDWVIIALVFAGLTSFISAGSYKLLAKKRLIYRKILAVQFASLFASKLLPAGLGALGLNFEYLRRQHHSPEAAGAVVATNNILGLVGHILLLGALILTTNLSLTQIVWKPHLTHGLYWIILVIGAIGILVVVWSRKLRSKIYRALVGMLRNIVGYRSRPLRLLAALVFSMCLTAAYTACLWACGYALGANFSFGQSLIVLTVGVVGSTTIPTPGGLGGAEAGLFAGLLAIKIPSAEALAIVLLYRFITYWMAFAYGALAWRYIRRHNYI